jgi:hypothetical protein
MDFERARAPGRNRGASSHGLPGERVQTTLQSIGAPLRAWATIERSTSSTAMNSLSWPITSPALDVAIRTPTPAADNGIAEGQASATQDSSRP